LFNLLKILGFRPCNAIGMFYLAICPWVSHDRLEHADVMVIAEFQEPFASELGAIVRDDAVGNPKAMNDVGEKQRGLLRSDVGNGTGLDPLGKLVNGNE
jgi:hypothetical protein